MAQETEHVLNFLKESRYTNNPNAEVYVVNDKQNIPAALLDNIKVAFHYGVKNTTKFANVYDRSAEKYEDISLSHLTQNTAHYLFVLDINEYTVVPGKASRSRVYLSADIKGLDIVSGTVICQEAIDLNVKLKNYSEYTFSESKEGEAFVKTIRERTGSAVRGYFRDAGLILKLGEIDGDKVKTVLVNQLEYMKSGSPKYLGVYRVDKINESDRHTSYTFLKVGELRSGKKLKDLTELKVGDGKKEILKYYNDGVPLYYTTMSLGPNE